MIYIAAPYSHPDKAVVEDRVSIVCQYSAYLLKEKISCISPITIGTGIFKYATLPSDFEFWQHLSYDLLRLCNEIFVIKLDGWDQSIGVTHEIEFANKNNIKITYVEIDYLNKILK